MTSSSKRLLALAHEFAARGGAVDERVEVVIMRGCFVDAEEQAEWVGLRAADLSPFGALQIYDLALGGDLETNEAFAPDRAVQVTIGKPGVAGVAAFVFSSGAAAYLTGSVPVPRLLCAQLEARAAFQARGLDVSPWDLEQALTQPEQPIQIKARPFVRDYVPGREVVEDLSPWMLSSAPAVGSPEHRAWSAMAGRRMMGALVSTATEDGGTVWLQVSGPPLVRFRADDPELARVGKLLTGCIVWVFLSGKDVEVRHLLFAAELARAFRSDQPLATILEHALESAKTTYEAHVQSSSRETLKALNDLRKSVIDEAQKVTQRAQDLTGGLWRDLAASSAPFVLKVLGDATKPANPAVTAGFYFAAAAFILTSFAFQCRINRDYLDNQRVARARWFETLYSYVSADERERIADSSIRRAEESYEKTRTAVGCVYLVLIFVLMMFGVATLAGIPRSAAAPPAKTVPVQGAAPAVTKAP